MSLLELEAQAEVDKFAAVPAAPLGRRRGGLGGGAAARGSSTGCATGRALAPEERWRYEEANRLGRSYCRRLMGHVTARRLESLLRELRYAYRLGAEAKLDYFACGA